MTPAPHVVDFAAGLYWRKSKLNGRKCVPAILSVTGGRLRLSAVDGVAFDVPCAEARARFTVFSTMVLTAAGRRFDLVGTGAAMSPKFTTAQLAELDALRARATTSGATGMFGGGGAELLSAAFDIVTMVAAIKPWRTVLPAAGVVVA
ncbi:hypothetical protein [Actinophytocola sp. KF-1]